MIDPRNPEHALLGDAEHALSSRVLRLGYGEAWASPVMDTHLRGPS